MEPAAIPARKAAADTTMNRQLRQTRSVCPVCLRNLPARLIGLEDGRVLMEKRCPEHGDFSVPVWNGRVDFEHWSRGAQPLGEGTGLCCPDQCGLCQEHESGSCCVLLEITSRCNLRCRFCFANGGTLAQEPDTETLKAEIADIAKRCNGPFLQLSGGEPTLREDLPELIRYAKQVGCPYVQLNTNGIALGNSPELALRLAEAGLDVVFLQFDGTDDAIYQQLRGRPLLEDKLRAIRNCGRAGIGVTLVPTVVKGVNDQNLRELIRLAASLTPDVRGIHFQPVSYLGRIPNAPQKEDRYPLDQLMADISTQAGIPLDSFLPSRCDHPLCGFHGVYFAEPDGTLRPLTNISHASLERTCSSQNRDYVFRRWHRPAETAAGAENLVGFDAFLYRMRHASLSLSAMAFQDAGNLNIERLHRCSLHVYRNGNVLPFCARYLTPMEPLP